MTYKRFDSLMKECKNQFIIRTKDDKLLFFKIGNIIYNNIGCLATNEKTFELEIIQYDDIQHAIVDGKLYK